jgi:hypothetical protein
MYRAIPKNSGLCQRRMTSDAQLPGILFVLGNMTFSINLWFAKRSQSMCVFLPPPIGRIVTSTIAADCLYSPSRGSGFVKRMVFRSRSKTQLKATIPAPHTANATFTTQFGAAPTLRSRNGRKFQVVM